MKISQKGSDILLTEIRDFSVAETLTCGQCFRWKKNQDESFTGVVGGKVCTISQPEEHTVLLQNVTLEDFHTLWQNYFDLNRDYGAIKSILCQNPTLEKAIAFAPGIHVLKQEPWEALCSFVISQNNKIKRIEEIIQRLCAMWGSPLAQGLYSFPTPEKIACLSLEDLSPLRCGFRDRYILDAAQKVSQGVVDFSRMENLSTEEARKELMQIVGVGVKVADCTLLFGMGRIDCLPADVWIKRALEQLFPQNIPAYAMEFAGIVQQYLYHYARVAPDSLPK